MYFLIFPVLENKTKIATVQESPMGVKLSFSATLIKQKESATLMLELASFLQKLN